MAQFKEKFEAYRAEFDRKLKDVKALDILEQKVKVPFIRVYAVVGVFAFLVLLIAAGVCSDFLAEVIGTVYPAYVSLRLISAPSVSQQDKTQWLSYWVIFSLYDILSYFEEYLFSWLPLFDLFKVAFFVWLFLPNTRGAEQVYRIVFQPLLARFDRSSARVELNKLADSAEAAAAATASSIAAAASGEPKKQQ